MSDLDIDKDSTARAFCNDCVRNHVPAYVAQALEHNEPCPLNTQGKYVDFGEQNGTPVTYGYIIRIFPKKHRKYSFSETQYAQIEKMVNWAKRCGAEAKILKLMEGVTPQAYCDVEITDPVAVMLEKKGIIRGRSNPKNKGFGR